MKLRTLIDNVHGRYNVQVETFGFTHQEEEQMSNFGEPLVEVGGAFSGSVARPDTQNTTVSIGGDGLGATAVPIVQGGIITGVTVTNPGTGYTVAPVSFVGDGAGASGTARFRLISLNIDNGGADFEENDIITLAGAPGDSPVQLRVDSVDVGGEILTLEVLSGGNFADVPSNPVNTWVTSGVGTGFIATAEWGIHSVEMISGGTGYNVVPLVVSFMLPTASRRLRTDSPFKQIFDLSDDPDSDAKAKVWADTVVARCLAAKTYLMNRVSPFEGETVITG